MAAQMQEEVGPLTYVKRRVKVEALWDRRGRVRVKVRAAYRQQADSHAAIGHSWRSQLPAVRGASALIMRCTLRYFGKAPGGM